MQACKFIASLILWSIVRLEYKRCNVSSHTTYERLSLLHLLETLRQHILQTFLYHIWNYFTHVYYEKPHSQALLLTAWQTFRKKLILPLWIDIRCMHGFYGKASIHSTWLFNGKDLISEGITLLWNGNGNVSKLCSHRTTDLLYYPALPFQSH